MKEMKEDIWGSQLSSRELMWVIDKRVVEGRLSGRIS
jgi:hypothetical protein